MVVVDPKVKHQVDFHREINNKVYDEESQEVVK
jgi:hypothetical protein